MDEYTQIIVPMLRGEAVAFTGDEYTVNAPGADLSDGIDEIPVLLAALGPRQLRTAGEHAHGTIPWLANATALENHIVPRITDAASAAGRPAPRIVAGLPVAVHDDEDEARETAEKIFGIYKTLVNYQRIFDHGDITCAGDAAIVGNEDSVASQIEAVIAAGATDFWAAPIAVGDDKAASRARTRALLISMLDE